MGNSSNTATAVAMSGDATMTNTGAVTISNNVVTSSKIADGTITASDLNAMGATTAGQVLRWTGSAWAPGVTSGLSSTLNAGQIYVGSATNIGTAVAMSGDGTLSNTGALTLANSGVTANTYGSTTQIPQLTVDSKGRITAVTNQSIATASGTTTGLLSSSDFNTFSSKQNSIALTTTGTTGPATLTGSTLNIPQYASSYLAGTGLALTGSTFSVNTSQNISTLSNLTTNGLIRTSGGTGALSIATAGTDYAPATSGTSILKGNGTGGFANAVAGTDYLTTNQSITVSGDVTGSGTTAIATTIGTGAGNNIVAAINNVGTSSTINDNRLTTIATAGKVSGSAITSGTIAGTTAVNTTGNIATTGTLSAGNTSITGLTVSGATTTINGASLTWPSSNTSGSLTNDGSGNLTWVPTGGGGTVTSITKGAGLVAGAAITTTGTIAVDVGTGANQIPQLDGTGKLNASTLPTTVDTNTSDDITTSSTASGDVTGTFPSLSIANNATAGNNIITAINSASAGTLPITRGGTGAGTPAGALSNLGAMGNTLTSANIFVGNAGNVATGVPMTGDIGITNAGLTSIANSATSGTNIIAAINNGGATGTIPDSKLSTISTAGKVSGSAITSGTIGGSTAINTTGTVSAGNTTVTGLTVGTAVWPANASGALTNDGSGVLTWVPAGGGGTVTSITKGVGLVAGANITTSGTIDVNVGTGANQIPQLDGTGKLNTSVLPTTVDTNTADDITNATASAGDVTGTFPTLSIANTLATGNNIITAINSASTGTVPIARGGTGANTPSGALTALGAMSNSLTSANIFVGSVGNVATGVPLTGDIGITNAGLTSIANSATSGTNIITAINNGGTTGTIPDSRLATISTAGKVSGSAITSGTIGGSTIINSTGNITTTGTLNTGSATVSGLTIGATTVNWPANTLGVLTNNGTGTLSWVPGTGWGLTGNAATVDGTNFIGTTDNIPLNFRVNNQRAARIDNAVNNNYFGWLAGNTGTGENNTAVGGSALLSNTSGEYNTAIGNFALQSNTTGIENMAGGSSALELNSTGSNNSALGFYALRNSTANFNTAIGHSAGLTITSGTQNTFVGTNADATSNTLAKATAIGYNAKVGASNSLVLGGTGVDAVNVGIGTTTPLTDLQVGTTTHLFDFPGATGLSFNLYENAGSILHTNTNGGSLLALQDGEVGLFVNADAAANSTFGSSMVNRMILTETGVSINKDAPDPSAVLHVVSETVGGGGTPRGFMMPSLITSDRNAIPSPLEGLMIYNNTDNEFNFYDGTAWQAVGGGGSLTSGNGITVSGSTIDLGGNVSGTTTFQGTADNMFEIQSSGAALGTKAGLHFKMFQSAVNTQYEFFARKTDGVANSGNSDLVMTKVFSTAGGYLDALTLDGGSSDITINKNKTTASPYGNFIVANGNVGIKSTTPSSTLEVRESLNGDRVMAVVGRSVSLGDFDGGGSGGYLFVDGDGTSNVGIGTLSPTAKLEVNGQVKITGGTPGAGKVLTSDASGLASWTTPSGTTLITNPGTRNLFAGDLSGAVNTATDNVFMGYSAGNANTSAGQNVFIGSAAGIDNITGGLSTIIGWRAGHLGTVIQGNTLIGAEAGRSSNASINTFVGEKSGQNTTTGGENVMLGSFTGNANITGTQLTIIGRSAEVSTSNLTNATAIGSRAMVGQSNSLVLGSIAGVNGATNSTNVGIGTTTPAHALDVTGYIRVAAGTGASNEGLLLATPAAGTSLISAGGRATTEFQINQTNNAPMTFRTNNTEKMRIDGAGNVGIGITAPTTDLHVGHLNGSPGAGDGFTIQNMAGAQTFNFFVSNATGNLVFYENGTLVGQFAASNGTYSPVSDKRLKKNIVDMEGVLPMISEIKIKRYHFKKQADSELSSIGVIAQDLKTVYPELVHYNPEADRYSVDYSGLSTLAIKAIQEQQEMIKSLKAKIEQLESSLNTEKNLSGNLSSKVETLEANMEMIIKSLGLDIKAKKQ